ncbi:MAG: two-component regulator propeller domain-containing protein [Niabella sp.]
MACKRLSVTVHLLLLFASLSAQEAYKIKYLSSSQGLSNNSVRCIYQDSRGFIWLGTYDGLNRYDGYEFKILRNRIADSTSLPHNYISAINEDDAGDLWIGTGQGLVKYNVLTSVFTPIYYYAYQSKQKERVSGYINSIERDAYGNMFLGTNGYGMLVKFKNRGEAVQLPVFDAKGRADIWYSVQSLHSDSSKRLWVTVSGKGLFRYDYKAKRIALINEAVKTFEINKMAPEGNDILWMSTSNGLLKYSISQNRVLHHFTAGPGQLSANYITTLSLDREGKLWIGTDGGGLDILDTHSGNITNIDKSPAGPLLSSKTVLGIFMDKELRKWIGTNKGGVNVFDVSGNMFNTIRRGAAYPGLSNNFITSFFEDAAHNLWIGTDGGGLNVWNADRNRFTVYQPPLLSGNIISSIAQDAAQNIWIATFGGGVNRLSKDGSVKHYRLINTDAYENRIAIRIYCDARNNLWVTTYENGHLYLYNKALDRFEVFDQNLGDLMSVYEDRQGVLWAGNSYQLVKIDRVNRKHHFYDIGKTVRCIFEDSKGNLWIGAEGGGLILFNAKAGKISTRYSEDDGLSSNTVMNILEDNAGNLWISTSNGLNRFNPQTRRFNSFYESDGLQNNQFSYRAALKLQSGELAFGGNNGFNIFDPSKISVRTYFPRVVITSLRVNNKNISAENNYKTDDEGDITRLTVPYNEAILSVQFAALEYSAPNKIQYAYYLEGWDKEWNMSGNVRTVTYNNIHEGAYTLRIKSTNATGTWNTKETIIKIKILPPWYRSWWAYLVYALVVGVVIYLYSRYKTTQAKMRYELKLARVNEEVRKAELESARMEKEVQRAELEKTHAEYEREKAERETEHVINEREKEINQKRLSFFTNISHEFRTPLTMIINPVQDMISRCQGKEKEELRIIGMNATRLLSLTNQLLLFRKIEEGAEGLTVGRFDFSALCHTVFNYFKHEAKIRNIHYTAAGIEHPLLLYGDKNKIEIILYNLIANAFKYTPKDGSIAVTVNTDGNFVRAIVEDTGMGIPEGTGNAIFERFYQARGHVKLGFGIGLYMVKQFTDMHQGTISYQSEPEKGTVFTLQLPLGKEHFAAMPITEEPADEKTPALQLEPDDDETEMAEIPPVPALITQKAILVVDDDEEIRDYVAAIFGESYMVYKASNGVEALEIAQSRKPDLIISDVSMPQMDGIAFCKAVKTDAGINHLPIILLTAHTSQEVELKGTEEGADYYITKPFSKSLLLARVNSIFKSRQNLQQYFYDQVTLKSSPAEHTVPAEYQELLNKCIAVVEGHLDNPDFNIEMLAREMTMSHSYLYKRIKLISGQSVNSFIRFLRLRKAAELLISTNDTVTEVAYRVGFSDVKYFREQFAKIFKMKPTDYIKQYRDKVADKLRVDKKQSGNF